MRRFPHVLLLAGLACGACSSASPSSGTQQSEPGEEVEEPPEVVVLAENSSATERDDGFDPCPVLTENRDNRRGGGTARSLVGDNFPTDLAGIGAALPLNAAGYARAELSPWPRGAAGHWSPVTGTVYGQGGTEIRLTITDLVHVCVANEHMTTALLHRAMEASTNSEARDFGSHRGMAASSPSGGVIQVWINDRCGLILDGGEPLSDLLRVAEAIDWPALSQACPPRPDA